MPQPRTTRGGAISLGGGSAPVVSVAVRVIGAEKTSDDFRQVRRDMNAALRTAQQRVGERHVLPVMTMRLRPIAGKWANTLYVKRDRLDVYIGSRLKGQQNRALGWLDFGGQRPRDHSRRPGSYHIVTTLQEQQPKIRESIQDAILDEFEAKGFEVN